MFSFKKLPLILTAAMAAFTLPSTHADTFCETLDTTEDGNFTILVSVLNSTDLCDALDVLEDPPGGTLFAPTDEAFEKLSKEELDCLTNENNTDALTDVLTYHVTVGKLDEDTLFTVGVPGADIPTLQGEPISVSVDDVTNPQMLMINDATVIVPVDEAVDNGIFHAIDMVLMPPGNKCLTPTFCGYLDTTEDGNFTTLLGALNSTGLCDALDGLEQGTLFAPTDEAFDKLPENILECLGNKTDALTDILLYHVAENELTSAGLTQIGEFDPSVPLKTLLKGETLSVNSTSGDILINDNSKVESPFDVDIVNGILHTINNVLVPPDTDFNKICNGTSTSSKSAKSSSKSKAGKRDKMAAAMALPSRGGGRISRNSREEDDEEIASLNEEEGLSMLFGRRTLKGENFLD